MYGSLVEYLLIVFNNIYTFFQDIIFISLIFNWECFTTKLMYIVISYIINDIT